MGKHTKWDKLDLARHKVPGELTELYSALQVASSDAIQGIRDGEAEPQRQWRLVSRICREFLRATEEPTQLALASDLGDWELARKVDKAPNDPYTYWMWLAALAWQLLQCCSEQAEYIEAVRHCAREGIIAVKTAPSLERVVAQRKANGESKVEERELGPKIKSPGSKPGVALRIV